MPRALSAELPLTARGRSDLSHPWPLDHGAMPSSTFASAVQELERISGVSLDE